MGSSNLSKPNGNSRETMQPNTPSSKLHQKGGFKANKESPKHRNRDTKCFNCQGFGHIASQYSNQRIMLILPNGEVLIDEEDEYEEMPLLIEEKDEELEEIPTNDKVGLVARRTLATQASKEEL